MYDMLIVCSMTIVNVDLLLELKQANSLLQEAHKRIKELEKVLDEEKQKSSSIMKQSLREKEELLGKISELKQEQGQHEVKDCKDASVQFDYLTPHSGIVCTCTCMYF